MGQVSWKKGCGLFFFHVDGYSVGSWENLLRTWKGDWEVGVLGETELTGFLRVSGREILYLGVSTSTLKILILPQTVFSVSLETNFPIIFPKSLAYLWTNLQVEMVGGQLCHRKASANTPGNSRGTCHLWVLSFSDALLSRYSSPLGGSCHGFFRLLYMGRWSFTFHLPCLLRQLKANIMY